MKRKLFLIAAMAVLLLAGCDGEDAGKTDVSSKQEDAAGEKKKIEVSDRKGSGEVGGEGLLFSVDGEKTEASLCGCDDLELTDVLIPDYIIYGEEEYPVTEIAASAFESNQSMEELTVGGQVRRIGESAFYSCPLLRKVVLSESVDSIGREAFAECEVLEEMKLSDTVKSIGESAFRACAGLKEVVLPAGVQTLGEGIYTDCSALESFTAEDGVKALGDGMFTNCSELAKVALPDSLTEIGAEAFWGCMELKEITLPQSVTKIGDKAFYSTDIASLQMPENLTGIDINMLDGMGTIGELLVPEAKLSEYEEVFGEYGVEIKTY